jgi:protein O-mannosyl-transferase
VEIDDQDTGVDLIRAAFSSDAGPLKRPISMLSFGLNVYAFGMDPWAMKLFNVLIHLLAGIGIYALLKVVLRHLQREGALAPSLKSELIALLASAIWLLHPMQLTSVLYVVQRMTSLSSLFSLLGLLAYAHGRTRGDLRGLISAVGGLAVFGLLSVLSKESGALILAYAFAIELCVFHFRSPDRRVRTVLLAGYGSLSLAALVGLIYLLSINPALLERAYVPREFTLGERLLTQPRILWEYVGEILLPLPSRLGLYHDQIRLSTSLLSPWTTLPSLIAWLGLLLFALLRHQTSPILAFAVLWFLAGHLMESTLVPLELKFEHRNYLSLMAPALLVALLVTRLRLPSSLGAVAGAIIVLALAGATLERANIWSDGLRIELSEAANNPNSSRANYQAGLAIVKTAQRRGDDLPPALMQARPYFQKAMASWPNFELGATGMILTYLFAEEVPSELVSELANRLRRAHNPTPAAVKDIIIAQAKGHLKISSEQVLTLLYALLENPRASPAVRALAMNKLGEYHFNYLREPQTAVTWTLAAIEEQPEAALFRINAANLALALGRPDLALQHLTEAERLDRIDLWAPEIANVRAKIGEAE